MPSRLAGWEVYGVSAFLLGDTLVDSGFARWARKLVPWAGERGVRRVVHTHHHEDHVGGSAALHRELGARVLAPPASLVLLARPYRLPFYRSLVWGQPEGVSAERLGAEVESDGSRFHVLRPLPAGGDPPVRVTAASDHRIAMAMAVAALRAGPLELDDAACVAKSYPEFWTHWERLVG